MAERLDFFDLSSASQWLDPIDLFLAGHIARQLLTNDPQAAVLEVGVYRGAWILSLGKNVPDMDRLVGIDPYPDEHAALRFELPKRVVELGLTSRFSHYDSWEEMERGESPEGVPNPYSLIHVDGDHTYEGVQRDLAFTQQWLAPGGVVIIDDFYNLHYPGIAAATYKWIDREGFAPFLLTTNKVYVARAADRDMWRAHLRRSLEASPLWFSEVPWRRESHGGATGRAKSDIDEGVLLCVDESGRTELLPNPRDRLVRRIGREWLPPKVATWVQGRSR